MNNKIRFIQGEKLKAFIRQILVIEGVDACVAGHVAEGLVQTSLRGVDSHGVRLFPHYVRALRAGRINPHPSYKFSQTSSSTGILDADHTYGHAAGMEAVKKVIELAKTSGSGNVSVKNSTHFGAAAFFALEIAKHDMVAMSFTHADSLMLTYNSTEPFLGTNPICFAVPCEGEEPFCLDMATTLISFNKVRQLREKNEVAPVNAGADEKGEETTDSHKIRSLLPIGGYKGFGLSLMVEILCGILSGMPYGRNITSMYKDPIEKKRNLGHFFSAMRIDCFQPVDDFKKRMRQLLDEIRKQPRKDDKVPIMVAGDPEKRVFSIRFKQGIPMEEITWREFTDLGEKYNIKLESR